MSDLPSLKLIAEPKGMIIAGCRNSFPFVLQLSDGEHVVADERFFRVEAKEATLSRDEWTAQEVEVMVAHRWWSRDELSQTSETVWPENLIEMLPEAGTP